MKDKNGFTLMEMLLVLGLMILVITLAIPSIQSIEEDLLLYQTTMEVEGILKFARHLSVDESKTYRVDIKNNHITVREDLFNTTPVLSIVLPEQIEVQKTTNNIISFNRNGSSGYHRVLLENNKKERFILECMIGTGRIRISR